MRLLFLAIPAILVAAGCASTTRQRMQSRAVDDDLTALVAMQAAQEAALRAQMAAELGSAQLDAMTLQSMQMMQAETPPPP